MPDIFVEPAFKLLPAVTLTRPAEEKIEVTLPKTQKSRTTAKPRPARRYMDVAPRRNTAAPRPSAKELRDREMQKALLNADFDKPTKAKKHRSKKPVARVHFGLKSIVLSVACAAAVVFAIVYFVNLNAPDISVKVAAMQSGIEAKYPSYVPRDFNLSDITSENGRIVLNFRNAETGDAFSLIEERSAWDSNALYTNYVREVFGEDSTAVKEQGLTLYISGSNAAWVNGGIVYKLRTTSGSLTKKQIRAIAVSL